MKSKTHPIIIKLFAEKKSKIIFIMVIAHIIIITACSTNLNNGKSEGLTSIDNSNEVINTQPVSKDIQGPILKSHGQTILKSMLLNEDNEKDYFDLDNTDIDITNTDTGDIVLQGSLGEWRLFYIRPVNGAKSFYTGQVNIGPDYCLEQKSKFTRGSVPEIEKGKQVCVLTNEGRVAIIKFISNKIIEIHKNEFGLKVEFSVWESTIPKK